MRKVITILLAVAMTLGSVLNLNLAYAFAESAITVDNEAPEEIKNDTIVQFTTTEENEITLFKFVPEETGWYKYYSADAKKYTVEGIIYDADKNPIEYSDNYVEGLHGTTLELNGPFNMISYFEAGKVYYLGSRAPYDVGEFEIGIKKVDKATSMSINQSDSTTVNIGQQRSFNIYFEPVDCEPEKITWTSDNTDVMEVDENGICYFKKLGKATLTATTENGLKDSLEVNVVNYQELKTDEEVQIVAGAGKSGGLTFIPDKNGGYNFSVKLSDFRVGLNVKLYDKNYQLITKERNYFNTIDIYSELVSGETYYLVYSSDKGDIWCNATITATIKTDDIVPEFEKGDLNKDNILSADDALALLKHVAKISELDEEQLTLADMNEDGIITADDALEILKIAAKIK